MQQQVWHVLQVSGGVYQKSEIKKTPISRYFSVFFKKVEFIDFATKAGCVDSPINRVAVVAQVY
ncbi:MAG: hypothetical protein ACRC2T_08690 [Thermoguttaceae bacterium]